MAEGIGTKDTAGLIASFGPIEDFPPDVIGGTWDLALLFKELATLLRTHASVGEELSDPQRCSELRSHVLSRRARVIGTTLSGGVSRSISSDANSQCSRTFLII